MLTTMDTLDSTSHSAAAKEGDVEVIDPLPPPAPAAHTLGTQGSLLASLPSRIGALWTSPEPGQRLGSQEWTQCDSEFPVQVYMMAFLPSHIKGPWKFSSSLIARCEHATRECIVSWRHPDMGIPACQPSVLPLGAGRHRHRQ